MRFPLIAMALITCALVGAGCGQDETSDDSGSTAAPPVPSEVTSAEKPVKTEKVQEEGSGIPEADAAKTAATAASDAASDQGFEVDPGTWEVSCQVDNDQLSSCSVSRQGCEGDVMIYRDSVGAKLEAQDASVACAD